MAQYRAPYHAPDPNRLSNEKKVKRELKKEKKKGKKEENEKDSKTSRRIEEFKEIVADLGNVFPGSTPRFLRSTAGLKIAVSLNDFLSDVI